MLHHGKNDWFGQTISIFISALDMRLDEFVREGVPVHLLVGVNLVPESLHVRPDGFEHVTQSVDRPSPGLAPGGEEASHLIYDVPRVTCTFLCIVDRTRTFFHPFFFFTAYVTIKDMIFSQ